MITGKNFYLKATNSVLDVINNIEESEYQICFILDGNDLLIGSITDGDIRRGLIEGYSIDSHASHIMNSNPISILNSQSESEAKKIMTANQIKHLPVVNKDNKLVGIHLKDQILNLAPKENSILIMAGGFGKRMMPLTENLPKPMLQVSGKPILEHIILNAKTQGFKNFIISIHYLGDLIIDHFGDGSNFDISIKYIHEKEPLGTAGALSILDPQPNLPFIVTNGDVMTDVNYSNLLHFHESNNSEATMAIKKYELQNPYGVVNTKGLEIISFEEKPIQISYVNAGIYAINPSTLKYLKSNERCDMPDFFERIKRKKHLISAYPIHETWADVGRPIDLSQANKS
ncbi:nucleotidyltransferase family protein [Gammaproteobacteria bacterium]|nr:nucleotidyltransferase family protein [Gammaproteobacteria bacterium]